MPFMCLFYGSVVTLTSHASDREPDVAVITAEPRLFMVTRAPVALYGSTLATLGLLEAQRTGVPEGVTLTDTVSDVPTT